MRRFFWVSLFLVGVQSVGADPVSLNSRSRAASMGHAGAALAGTEDSALMNPAALNDIEKWKLQILPITFEIPFAVGLVNDYLDLQETLDSSAADSEKRTAFNDFLSDVSVEAVSTRVNIYPSYTRKNMHFGVMVDALANPRFRVGGITGNEVVDMGGSAGTAAGIVGGSYSFMEGRLQVGATLKPLYRVSLTQEQIVSVYDFIKGRDPNNEIKDELMGAGTLPARRGFGVGFDLGAKYAIPFLEEELKPTVALTYQDIGNTRFLGKNVPRNIEQSVSLAFAIEKTLSFTKTAVAVDFRNLNEQQEFWNKVHLGAETKFWNFLALRAGLSQLYWTVGLGLNAKIFEWDVYVTAREAGEKAHIQGERSLGTRISFAL